MFLNVIQLAESLGVAENVVEDWVRREGLPCVRDSSRMLFDRALVVAWAAERGLAAKAGFLTATEGVATGGGRLERWTRAGGVWRDVAPFRVREIFARAVEALPGASPAVRAMLVKRVHAVDGVTWAPVGGGLALPHLRSHVALGREAGVVAFLFLTEGMPLEGDLAPDGELVNRMIFFVAPSPRAHLELLAQLSTALTRGTLRQRVERGAEEEEIFAALREMEGKVGP